MTVTSLNQARKAALSLLSDHPVLSKFGEHLTVLIVGSIGSGFADEFSDVDIWILCSDEASKVVSEEMQQAGFRFEVPPPHDITIDGIETHYFVFQLSKFRQALEKYDDETLFVLAHCQPIYDPSHQFAALVEHFAKLPVEVITNKVENAVTLIRQGVFSLRGEMRRYQPLVWLESSHRIAHITLELCCWLDGQAPTGRKWLMQQAQACSTASMLIPAVIQFLNAIGPTISQKTINECADAPLLLTAKALDAAVIEAINRVNLYQINLWVPPI